MDDPTTSTNLTSLEPPRPPEPSAGATPPAQPDWRPPQAEHGRNGALVFGVVLLIIGGWFFATLTLGLDLPDLDWDPLSPVALIGLGAWIVLNAFRQRST